MLINRLHEAAISCNQEIWRGNMKLLCKIFGHSKKVTYSDDKDMFGFSYVWQKKYCNRCGKRIN